MINKVSTNTNFNGYVLKTNIKSLPNNVQNKFDILKESVYRKPYNLTINYNKNDEILDFIFVKRDSWYNKYIIHSVKYDDNKTNVISEFLAGDKIYHEKTQNIFEKTYQKIVNFINKKR